MAKSLQVTVTNPDDLNTLQGELVTQNYNLEILGLKNPADFRKFSKSLMMLDRILKESLETLNKQEIENLLGFNTIRKEFVLATLDDIKNLFPGSGGTSGAFDLGHISNDSTKIVNMMLLSNYNEYLQQKILQIKDFFNNLNSNKADKTTKIIVGDGLLGTGSLERNINITVDKLSTTEIQNLLNNWR